MELEAWEAPLVSILLRPATRSVNSNRRQQLGSFGRFCAQRDYLLESCDDSAVQDVPGLGFG